MPPGTYEVRVIGRFGISGARLFAVQRGLSEVAEKGPNDDAPTAQVVPMNCAIDAASDNNGDDFDRFAAKKGQRVTIREFCLAVRGKAPYAVQLPAEKLSVAAGSMLETSAKVVRQWPDFKGKVQRIGRNLPPGFSFATTEIAVDQTKAKIKRNVAANVPPGDYSVVLRADAQVPYHRDPAATSRPNVRVADPSTPMLVQVLPPVKKK